MDNGRRWAWLKESPGRGFPSDWFMIGTALLGALFLFGVSRSFEDLTAVLAMLLWIPGLVMLYPAMVLIGCAMKFFMWTRAGSRPKRMIAALLGGLAFWAYLEIAIPYF